MAHHSPNLDDADFRGGRFGFRSDGFPQRGGLTAGRFVFGSVVNLAEVQTQSVHTDGETGKAHAGGADHGVHLPFEEPRRQRDADEIVEESPEQVLVNVFQYRTGKAHRGRHIGQGAVHQDNIGGVNGDVRAGADGDADIRTGQRRSVIDAVADHSGLPLFLQFANRRFLPIGEHSGDHVIHASLRADRFRGSFVVPGQHDDADTLIAQLPDGLGGFCLDGVRHGDDADKTTAALKEERRFSFPGKTFSGLCRRRVGFVPSEDKAGVSAANLIPVDDAFQPVPREGFEVPRLAGGNAAAFGFCGDGFGKRVFAHSLKGISRAEQFRLGTARRRQDIRDLRLAGGNRAGLVQCGDLDLADIFQSLGGLEENAVLRADTAADHNGDRRRQSQRTGTGDDQHRNRARQREAQRPSRNQPSGKHDKRNADHRRDEHAGDFIRNAGNRRLRGGGVGHHADDLRQACVRADAGRAAVEMPGLIDGSGRNRVARVFIDRDGFAGQGGFVNRA